MLITVEKLIILITMFVCVMTDRPKLQTERHKHSKKLRTTSEAAETTTKYLTTEKYESTESQELPDFLAHKLKDLIGEDESKRIEFLDYIKEVLGVNSESKNDTIIASNDTLRYGGNVLNGNTGILLPQPEEIPYAPAPVLHQDLPTIIPPSVYLAALRRSMVLNPGNFALWPQINNILAHRDLSPQPMTSQSVLPPQPISSRQMPYNNPTMQYLSQRNGLDGMVRQVKVMQPVDLNDNAYPYEPVGK